MTTDQIQDKLKNFTGWEYQGDVIEKTYFKNDMMDAVEMVNKITVIAESMSQYPETIIKFNKLTLRVGNEEITEQDFKLIKEIEKAAVELL